MIKLTANLSHLFAGNSYNKLNNWEVEDSKKKKKEKKQIWSKLPPTKSIHNSLVTTNTWKFIKEANRN
jgi:hypothetical protein